MDIFFDILLIIISSFCFYKSYNTIIFEKNKSIANYLILVIYLFCIFPIMCDYIFGKPKYTGVYWYQPFIAPMNNSTITIIYDIYIISSIVLLYIYSIHIQKNNIAKENKKIFEINIKNNLLIWLSIFLPIIYILITGNLNKYFIYASTETRGLTSSFSFVMNSLLLISLFFFFSSFFSKNKKNYFILIIYSLLIIWISGKRFMIANITIIYFFYITQSNLNIRQRKIIYFLIPISVLCIFIFSTFYLIYIKPLSVQTFDNIYSMLRVDFGRDEVIKYIINEIIINGNQILDYPGQSIIAIFTFFIPRSIWINKPLPHYNYLTASILNIPITQINAGTTPSWYEMCLANFGVIGFFIACISLVLFCAIIDKYDNLTLKSLGFTLLFVLITQSTDAYLIVIIMFIFCILIKKLFRKIKVII